MAFFSNVRSRVGQLARFPDAFMAARNASTQRRALETRIARPTERQSMKNIWSGLPMGQMNLPTKPIAARPPSLGAQVKPPPYRGTPRTSIPIAPQIQQNQQAQTLPQLPNTGYGDSYSDSYGDSYTGYESYNPPPQLGYNVDGTQQLPSAPQENPYIAQLSALQARLTQAGQVSPGEEQAQKDLNNLTYSRELGLRNTEEQPIAMDFITGQKSAIERRAATQSIPLTQRLALEQAKRQAAYGSVKDEIEITKAKAGLEKTATENKPIEVGGNLVQLNPKTGRYESVYQGQQEYKAPSTLTTDEGIMQFNPATGEWDSTGYNPPTPADERKASMEKSTEAVKRTETANAAMTTIDRLLNNPGLTYATGRSGYLPTWSMPAESRSAVQDFDSLKALLTLENMGIMKGVLSDSDIKVLNNASFELNRGMETEQIKTRLNAIRAKLQMVIDAGGFRADSTQGGGDPLGLF